jgi:putative transposase
MEEDSLVRLPRPGASVTDSPLLEVLRSGARRMLQQVIEAEIEAFLAAHADLEDAHGRRRLVRNGHAPEREIQTGIGRIAVRRPKLRDHGDGADGERIRFTSKVLPPFLRRTRNVEELLPWLYLKGHFGPDAPGLSAPTVRRPVATWQQEHDRCQRRDLVWHHRRQCGWRQFHPRCDAHGECLERLAAFLGDLECSTGRPYRPC